ncbi:MAG: MHYT domain-containing protein [Parvibaculum sp.]
MLTVYDCITVEHNLRLVFMAGLVCLFASSSSISLLVRSREAGSWRRSLWVGAAGIVAGCGIWATHFIAMLSYRPHDPVGYDPGMTFASFLIAIAFSGIGFSVAARYRPAGLGGAIVGFAIAAMHYVGMSATSAHGLMVWDHNFVAASIVLGVVLGTAALQAAQTLRGNRGVAAGSVLLTLAICSLHFTGMAALTISYNADMPLSDTILEPYAVAIAVAAVTLFIVALAFIGTAVDRHLADRAVQETKRLRSYVQELEETKRKLETTSAELLVALGNASSADQAKSQFLATMSHELRTPLNAILGFSEIMKLESFGPLGSERYRDYAQDIFKSGRHLLSLINDVLDFTRADAGALNLHDEDIDIHETVDDAMRMIEAQAEAQTITLQTDIPHALPHIRGDHRRILQVLMNILSNAVKFTPDGGEVRVSAIAEDGTVKLRVSDTGIGIAAKDIPRALERFGQIDSDLARKYEGTGLGLPLSKCLMESHNGTLDIESEPKRGTTVTLIFPRERVIAVPATEANPIPLRTIRQA